MDIKLDKKDIIKIQNSLIQSIDYKNSQININTTEWSSELDMAVVPVEFRKEEARLQREVNSLRSIFYKLEKYLK